MSIHWQRASKKLASGDSVDSGPADQLLLEDAELTEVLLIERPLRGLELLLQLAADGKGPISLSISIPSVRRPGLMSRSSFDRLGCLLSSPASYLETLQCQSGLTQSYEPSRRSCNKYWP
jgi:hypothetical protein